MFTNGLAFVHNMALKSCHQAQKPTMLRREPGSTRSRKSLLERVTAANGFPFRLEPSHESARALEKLLDQRSRVAALEAAE